MSRQSLLAKIHIAQKQLALAEDDYRALLMRVTGKTSSRDCNEAELGRVISALVQLGFKASSKGAPDGRKSPRANVRLIFGLWAELGAKKLIENATRPALFAFVQRMTQVSHPDWLDNRQASMVVEALKAMRDRGSREGA
jgi:hypothetical protein